MFHNHRNNRGNKNSHSNNPTQKIDEIPIIFLLCLKTAYYEAQNFVNVFNVVCHIAFAKTLIKSKITLLTFYLPPQYFSVA